MGVGCLNPTIRYKAYTCVNIEPGGFYLMDEDFRSELCDIEPMS